jgi:ABC-2 type transport system permease protein
MNGHALLLWWSRIIAMTVKELKQLMRDPVLLLIIAYFFTADIYMAGDGINMNLRNASLMVIDHDHSAASRELVYRFVNLILILKAKFPVRVKLRTC